MRTSFVVDPGCFEFIERRHVIIFILSSGNAFVTESTAELLIKNLGNFFVNSKNSSWFRKSDALYFVKEIFVSGAYGGSRYTKSRESTFARNASYDTLVNSTCCISFEILFKASSSKNEGFL